MCYSFPGFVQAFKTLLAPGIELKDHDKTDLNVSVCEMFFDGFVVEPS
jgi:hypothetical protein